MTHPDIPQPPDTEREGAITAATPFETILDQLEELVKKLEQGSLPLETSLALFEKGMALSKLGSQKLEMAERKVEQLLQNKGGDIALEPFPTESDE